MVLSFGELLLRICPDTEGEWLERNNLSFYVGGAEANVATALALWGIPSAYATALPENMISQQLIAYLEEKASIPRASYTVEKEWDYIFFPKEKT